MKYVQELVKLITRNKTKNLAVLDLQHAPKSQVNRLYQAIADNKVNSDEEASKMLFGSPKDSRYNKVKYDLKQRLLNTVFFIDANQRHTSEAAKAYYHLYRQYTCASILWRRGVRDTAIHLLEKILPKAQEYEFTEIVVGSARLLRYYHGVLSRNKAMYRRYKKTASEWEEIQYAENKIGDYYEELLAYFADTVDASSQQKAHSRAQEIVQDIYKEENQIKTLYFNFSRYFIMVVLYMSDHDYRNTINLCNEALDYLATKKHTPNGYRRMFLLQIISSSIILKDLDEGKKAIATYIERAKEGSFAWFDIHELQLILFLHNLRYKEAYQTFYELFRHKKFKTLTPISQERWKIYEAYLQWLKAIGKIDCLEEENKKFKLGKFFNELEIAPKDKGGMNIPILIIQTLWLVNRKDYEQARTKIENLDRYNNRYLKKDDMYRTQLFIRMISQLAKGNFHRVAVQRKANRYHEKLIVHPLSIAQQSFRLEIIPYEYIWEYLLELLDLNIH